MGTNLKKRASKRVALKQKYKVERKIREHTRKVRKEERERGPQKKKDPGIPNLWPFKEEMLRQAEKRKEKVEEEKQRQKIARQKEMQSRRMEKGPRAGTTEDLVKRAEDQMKSFVAAQKSKSADTAHMSAKEKTERKTFMKEVKKVVETADVLLEVLDARDPIGCRCPSLEESILTSGQKKKIILVLNKIDLVPPEVVEKWLKFFRQELPTVAFKCSTQTQRKNLGHKSLNTKAAQTSTSDCLGADALMSLLKNYARSGDIKTSVVVGVFGFPNTGKSSLINSLMRSKAVGVGATPGFTKVTSEVHLDKNIKLLDCPGVVFAKGGENDPNVILRNCVKIEQISDLFSPVELIAKRCGKEQLRRIYNIEAYNDVNHFLALVARKIGKLKKKGVPDIEAAARSVIKDWTSGRISYYTMPPKSSTSILSSTVVSSFSKELDLDDLLKEHDSTLFTTLQNTVKKNNFMEVNPGDTITDLDLDKKFEDEELGDAVDSEEEQEEEEDDDQGFVVNEDDEMETDSSYQMGQNKKEKKGKTTQVSVDDQEDIFNPQTNKSLKKKQKALKKKKSQAAAETTTASTKPSSTVKSKAAPKPSKSSGTGNAASQLHDQAYDFANDFVDDDQEIGDVDV